MSDEGVNKIKALFKGKAEEFAEKAGQKIGEVAFEAKKALDAASPLARSTLAEIGQALDSARSSFQQALSQAEAKARDRAEQESRAKAEAASSSAQAPRADAQPPGSGSGSA